MDDLIGQALGRYKIFRLLARRGLAKIYEGMDSAQGRTVLIKALPALLSDEPSWQERFLEIGERLISLRSPYIIPVRDLLQEGKAFYLVTEMVRASPLHERIKGPFRVENALELARQIGQALASAHEQGLIHGNLNPQNVLLTSESRAMVADFGLEELLSAARAGTKRAWPAYIAPEARAGKPLDARSDIYSLGALLYHLLTGRPPEAIGPEGFPPPSHFNPAIPPAVEDAILRALAPEPEERFSNVKEMLMALGLTLAAPEAVRPAHRGAEEIAPTPEQIEEPKAERARIKVAERPFIEEEVPFPETAPIPTLDMDATWSALKETFAPSLPEPPPISGPDMEAFWDSLAYSLEEQKIPLPTMETPSWPEPLPFPEMEMPMLEKVEQEVEEVKEIMPPSPKPEAPPPAPPRPEVEPAAQMPVRKKLRPRAPAIRPAAPEAKAPARPERKPGRRLLRLVFFVIAASFLIPCFLCGLILFLIETKVEETPTPETSKGKPFFITPIPTESGGYITPTSTRRPTKTPTPAPTTTPRGLLFADDFSDPDSGWQVRIKNEYEMDYENGHFRISVKSPYQFVYSLAGQNFTDFILETDALLVEGPSDGDFGVLFRQKKVEYYYCFRLRGDGYYAFDRRENGEWINLVEWKRSPYIKGVGEGNSLKVVCRGSEMIFYVNGHRLAKVEDDVFINGDIGLMAVTQSKGGLLVNFDNLRVFELP